MKVGIIGSQGNLGSSVTNLLLKNGFGNRLFLSDIKGYNNNSHVINKSNVLFLCVKPKDIGNVLSKIKKNNQIIISCIAGVNLNDIEMSLNTSRNNVIFRCMMNLPIGLGEGTITYIGNQNVRMNHYQILNKLLQGPKMVLVENESLIDVSTILTGSMPAFISYLSQEIIRFGVNHGFGEMESKELYCETVKGTMNMLLEKSTQQIIREVSSPNGVTEKGIVKLRDSQIKDILHETLLSSLNQIKRLKD
jgi:pyrroline-5-carboxylate reductase